jgi:2-amino-4-hydroxy-6-hydroxymethyldihydropteridine diphosphokinase
VLAAAVTALAEDGHAIISVSPVLDTAPLVASQRRFANAVALVGSDFGPIEILARLQSLERRFGRRPGRRWGARVLDLDLILWSGGRWRSRNLIIPHSAMTERDFVLRPLLEVAPRWKAPGMLTPRHHLARLTRPRPNHRADAWSGP